MLGLCHLATLETNIAHLHRHLEQVVHLLLEIFARIRTLELNGKPFFRLTRLLLESGKGKQLHEIVMRIVDLGVEFQFNQ